jgi:hypothetical protein
VGVPECECKTQALTQKRALHPSDFNESIKFPVINIKDFPKTSLKQPAQGHH